MDSVPASEARRRLSELVDAVQETHEPIRIVGERGNAVLIADEDWRAVQETLCLVSIPGLRESIIDGMATPPDWLAGSLDW